MQNKSISLNFQKERIPAGIDSCEIEFFGISQTKSVKFIQNGRTHCFSELSPQIFVELNKLYNRDLSAKRLLSKGSSPQRRQVELYTYYMFGSLDSTPDLIKGTFQLSENYRHTLDCISLNFDNKKITIDGNEINRRDLMIVDMIAADLPDKTMASNLGISESTFGFHKKNLLSKTNSLTKTAVLFKAMREKIIN